LLLSEGECISQIEIRGEDEVEAVTFITNTGFKSTKYVTDISNHGNAVFVISWQLYHLIFSERDAAYCKEDSAHRKLQRRYRTPQRIHQSVAWILAKKMSDFSSSYPTSVLALFPYTL
jgi:hypothetical protein